MKILLTAAFAALCALPVSAQDKIAEYIEWIADNSDLVYNGEPLPSVDYVDPRLLEIMLYGEENVAQSERNGTTLQEVLAVYDNRIDTMILPFGFDLNAFESAHVVVHELVHYMQDINGIEEECIPKLEPLAYELHTKWMDEMNHPGDRPDPLFLFFMVMACEDDFR